MAINQAIYTSSARGIRKGGGRGIHSYNKEINEEELKEFEENYCRYEYAGDSGQIPMLPVKVVFGRAAGRYFLSHITYLGKDYSKVSGRMGNVLGHLLSFGKQDFTCYPMQLYKNSLIRTSMEPREVDGTTEVGYLPVLSAVEPDTEDVSFSSVQEFLLAGRQEIFYHLLAAVFKIDEVHKIILADEHEHIIMWLAAIEYALPLKAALEISFSSLEDDPCISEFDIRGAVAGLSKGNCEKYREEEHFYVFDIENMKYPRFDVSASYFQRGIRWGMLSFYDSWKKIMDFLNGYRCEKAGDALCSGFKLYQILQNSLKDADKEELDEAVGFEEKYGNKSTYRYMMQRILENLHGPASADGQENNQDSVPTERQENRYTPVPADKQMTENISRLLTKYIQQDLNEQEWASALNFLLCIEKICKENKLYSKTDTGTWYSKLWMEVCQKAIEEEREDGLIDWLCEKVLYVKAAAFCAKLITQKGKDLRRQKGGLLQTAEYTKWLFDRYKLSVPEKEWKCFDRLAAAAAEILEGCKEEEESVSCGKEETYKSALELFSYIERAGDGRVMGKGMEQLIGIIHKGTQIVEEPHKNFMIRKKVSDGSEELEELQSVCAYGIFNYVQRSGKELPDARIRLLHLKRCMIKARENEIPFEKSKMLKIYEEYPVIIGEDCAGDFVEYMEEISEAVVVSGHRTEYQMLLKFWILDRQQKSILLQSFLDRECSCLKKDGWGGGIASLAETVFQSGDDEYAEALQNIIRTMKSTQQEKTAAVLEDILGPGSAAFRFWAGAAKKQESGKKKSIFPFKKH